jgi:SET domain-containing protein
MYPKKTNGKKSPRSHSETAAAPAPRGRIQVRRSGIHGKGVFALKPIPAGTRIIEYTGDIITWKEAQKRHPHDPDDPNHTFFFHIDDKRVIDGGPGASAKSINPACDPNGEADHAEAPGRVFIKSLRDIAPGEELNYDYGLVLEGRQTKKAKEQFACRCGSKKCRGTMLAPKGR